MESLKSLLNKIRLGEPNRMLVYGNRVSGILKPVPETLGYTKPSEVYELHIQTEPFPEEDESTAIDMLMTLEQKFPDLKILHIESCSHGLVKLQFMDKGPDQISFSGLFSALPAILIIIGIIIVGYILWNVYQTQSIVLWALALVGGAVAFFFLVGEKYPKLPAIGVIRTTGEEGKEGKRIIKTATERLADQRLATQRIVSSSNSQLDRIAADIIKYETKIDEVETAIKKLEKKEKPIPQSFIDTKDRYGTLLAQAESSKKEEEQHLKEGQDRLRQIDSELAGIKKK